MTLLVTAYVLIGYIFLLLSARWRLFNFRVSNPVALILALFIAFGWVLVLLYWLLLAVTVVVCRILSGDKPPSA